MRVLGDLKTLRHVSPRNGIEGRDQESRDRVRGPVACPLSLQMGVAAIIIRVLCRQRPRLSKGVGLPELRKLVVGRI